ncbi:MAG: TetR/AcrR family transcriptional regulator [Actinomycetota bacterium]
MPSLAQVDKELRRRNLLDAAWRCVAGKGFGDLTVDDVCEEAGVSKGSFYGYFESKQALLLGLLDDDAAALEARIAEVEASRASGRARVEGFVRAMLQRGEDAARTQLLADLWSNVSADAALQKRFSETVRRRRMLLRSWIEEATAAGELREVPANALAAILLALGDGLMLHASIDPAGFQWRNVRRVLGMLLEGLTPGVDGD